MATDPVRSRSAGTQAAGGEARRLRGSAPATTTTPWSWASRACCAALLMALASCGGPATGPESPEAQGRAARPAGAERYFPLGGDRVYVYDTEAEGTGEQGVLMLQIVRHGDITELGVGGRKHRVQAVRGGIQYLAGGWVLKEPLTLGATWKGSAGSVRIEAVDLLVSVPAGRYGGCLRTVEESNIPGESRRITTTWCPDVGIVELVVEGQSGADYSLERARLKRFGPRVDLDAFESGVAMPPP